MLKPWMPTSSDTKNIVNWCNDLKQSLLVFNLYLDRVFANSPMPLRLLHVTIRLKLPPIHLKQLNSVALYILLQYAKNNKFN